MTDPFEQRYVCKVCGVDRPASSLDWIDHGWQPPPLPDELLHWWHGSCWTAVCRLCRSASELIRIVLGIRPEPRDVGRDLWFVRGGLQ
jgi:hypothetical protein